MTFKPPPTKPKPGATGSTSTNTTGGDTKGGSKGKTNHVVPGTGVLGTSTNPIYGGGSTIMSSINSLTTPGDRGAHPGRNPGAPISHQGHQFNN